jgi:hypothetical protein
MGLKETDRKLDTSALDKMMDLQSFLSEWTPKTIVTAREMLGVVVLIMLLPDLFFVRSARNDLQRIIR